MPFVKSGVFGYNNGKNAFGIAVREKDDPYNEVCLACGYIKFNHSYGCCFENGWKFQYSTFRNRDLDLPDLEHYFFKSSQYLSMKEV